MRSLYGRRDFACPLRRSRDRQSQILKNVRSTLFLPHCEAAHRQILGIHRLDYFTCFIFLNQFWDSQKSQRRLLQKKCYPNYLKTVSCIMISSFSVFSIFSVISIPVPLVSIMKIGMGPVSPSVSSITVINSTPRSHIISVVWRHWLKYMKWRIYFYQKLFYLRDHVWSHIHIISDIMLGSVRPPEVIIVSGGMAHSVLTRVSPVTTVTSIWSFTFFAWLENVTWR